jgi:hypothetical protein
MLPVPNIDLGRIPECQKYLAEGRHRWLYTNSPSDYTAMDGIWGNGETALPGDPPGELEVVEGVPDGGKIPDLNGLASAFIPSTRLKRCLKLRRSSMQPRADLAITCVEMRFGEQTLQSGTSVSCVARRHGLSPSSLVRPGLG